MSNTSSWIPTVTGGFTSDHDINIANMTSGVENHDWVMIVDAVILTGTILGALSILLSMAFLEWKGRPSTTRMRIVQSLVLSDLALGIVGLTGVGLSLSDHGLKAGASCDGLGTVLVAVIWSEHFWTLSLAFATFMILIHPLHRVTMRLEKQWYILWIFIWVLCIGIAVMGLELYGFVPSGGICTYPSRSGLYGELMGFIPRAVVFIVITFFYARLFVFLRRPDKIRSPYSNTPTGSFTGAHRSSFFGAASRRPAIISALFKKTPPKDFNQEHVIERKISIALPTPDVAQDSAVENPESASDPAFQSAQHLPPVSPTSEIPPWERVELPMFQIDGQKFGGASANSHPGSGTATPIWTNWKGLGGPNHRDGRKRPSTASSYSPPPQSTRKFGSGSSMMIPELVMSERERSSTSPSTLITPRLESIQSMYDPLTIPEGEKTPTQSYYAMMGKRGSTSSAIDRLRQSSVTSNPESSNLTTPSDPGFRRSSAATQASKASSAAGQGRDVNPTGPYPQPSLSSGDSEVEKGGSGSGGSGEKLQRIDGSEDIGNGDDDNDWDLMKMLQNTAPPRSAEDRFAPREGETIELVEESMASYLNRKTALLMLWFPLGYVLLFSVSLIRIIYDFVGTPPTSLRAISRWFIFAQGVLDALIYGLVEWHTKRVVRKRVKRGTFSPTSSPGGGSWPRNILSRRTNPSASNGNPTSQTSHNIPRNPQNSVISRTHGQHSVAFAETVGERSILQELRLDPKDLVEAEERRGSGAGDSVSTKTTGTGKESSNLQS